MALRKGFRDGDCRAEHLYAELRLPLIRFFMRRVKDRADAEDLTQEVFSRLLNSSNASSPVDPKGFVFQIAINLLRDRGRRGQVRNTALLSDVYFGPVDEIAGEFLEDRDPERVLLGRESVAQVVRALSELNERTRDIYILFRLENMKQHDIASLYGISRSTVEKEIMRVTMHLALRFERESR
ncbi:RNA polymerase sigma factor [Sphingomonas mali]|uniref:RNA polymerase sigma factor n=1 Tax=Sphingomonas mali TaxID=40682 RepID=UPI000A051B93|nr:sigma-70 family RNA polymerase sigma factor [Sphingomonas mali]